MKLFFCGGAGEVGASCVLLESAGKRILFDCGMRMKGDSMPDLQTIKDRGGLDLIILSHAHMDHSGTLPVICREFPEACVYMTHPTADLVRTLLYDSLKIMEHESELPVYDKKHVEQMLENVRTAGFSDTTLPFDGLDFKLTFYQAGHILGAASVYLETPDGTVLYTGDISAVNQKSINGMDIPRLRPDVCIIESTYGNRLHSNIDTEHQRLTNLVGEKLNDGGRVLIPAFAVGRSQEVLLSLRSAMNRGSIPIVPVYVDGMVREVCSIYNRHPNYLRQSLAKRIWKGVDVFFCDNVIAVRDNTHRQEIMASKEPCVIVSSSGMLSGGPSAMYAAELAKDESAFICITGYQDEESPGRKLQELFASDAEEKAWSINGTQTTFRCGVGTYGLSAHADKNELLGLVRKLQPRRTFWVHGDKDALTTIGEESKREFKGRIYTPSNGAQFMVDTAGGRRMRKIKELPDSMNELGEIEPLRLSEYLRFIGQNGPWTARELSHIWNSTFEVSRDAEYALMEQLIEANGFSADPRRLYLFTAREPEAAKVVGGPMEVNAMLARAAEYFPPSTGCYKTGARLESHIARLMFEFPAIALREYTQLFETFKTETGWGVEINENPDASKIQPLISKLLGDGAPLLKKVALHLDQNMVKVKLESMPADERLIVTCFEQQTGMKLVLDAGDVTAVAESQELPGGTSLATEPLVNQQQAMMLIDDVFEPAGIKVYKKSIKTDAAGKYIELQFITQEFGRRFENWIQGLRESTGWRIVCARNPRQQDLINLARQFLAEHNLTIVKGPSILMGSAVKVKLSEAPEEPVCSKLTTEYDEQTGYALQIENIER